MPRNPCFDRGAGPPCDWPLMAQGLLRRFDGIDAERIQRNNSLSNQSPQCLFLSKLIMKGVNRLEQHGQLACYMPRHQALVVLFRAIYAMSLMSRVLGVRWVRSSPCKFYFL